MVYISEIAALYLQRHYYFVLLDTICANLLVQTLLKMQTVWSLVTIISIPYEK